LAVRDVPGDEGKGIKGVTLVLPHELNLGALFPATAACPREFRLQTLGPATARTVSHRDSWERRKNPLLTDRVAGRELGKGGLQQILQKRPGSCRHPRLPPSGGSA